MQWPSRWGMWFLNPRISLVAFTLKYIERFRLKSPLFRERGPLSQCKSGNHSILGHCQLPPPWVLCVGLVMCLLDTKPHFPPKNDAKCIEKLSSILRFHHVKKIAEVLKFFVNAQDNLQSPRRALPLNFLNFARNLRISVAGHVFTNLEWAGIWSILTQLQVYNEIEPS